MLNKVMLLCAAEIPEMGWYVDVESWIQGNLPCYGSNSNHGKIISFNGAPNLSSIQTFMRNTSIVRTNGGSLTKGVIYRKDKEIRKDLSLSGSWELFSSSDAGKTVTVYYIPA